MGRGLLGRISEIGKGESPGPVDVRDSIASHLRVLLNTAQGDSPTVPQFGVMDFTDVVHSFPASVGAIQSSIRAVVLQYEPRLRNVSVRYLPDSENLTLRFEVTAQLADKSARGVLRFQTKLAAGGQFLVED